MPAPECQTASKRHSQGRWLAKPQNRDYFRGPENVQRVQAWRAEHPGYGKRSPRNGEPTAWALYLVLVTVADAQGLSYFTRRPP